MERKRMEKMYHKECFHCGCSSFSPWHQLSWTCIWCGTDLTDQPLKPLVPGEPVIVGPGGEYCALCASRLIKKKKDELFCPSCRQRYIVRYLEK
jgi:predicted RNA-binding Zn-ribbon protein involved in translation (DUF1610 family)